MQISYQRWPCAIDSYQSLISSEGQQSVTKPITATCGASHQQHCGFLKASSWLNCPRLFCPSAAAQRSNDPTSKTLQQLRRTPESDTAQKLIYIFSYTQRKWPGPGFKSAVGFARRRAELNWSLAGKFNGKRG